MLLPENLLKTLEHSDSLSNTTFPSDGGQL